MSVDETGIFNIFEYEIDLKGRTGNEIIVYNSKTKENFEVPYLVYFERFGALLKQLDELSKRGIDMDKSIYTIYYEKFGNLMKELETKFKDKGV